MAAAAASRESLAAAVDDAVSSGLTTKATFRTTCATLAEVVGQLDAAEMDEKKPKLNDAASDAALVADLLKLVSKVDRVLAARFTAEKFFLAALPVVVAVEGLLRTVAGVQVLPRAGEPADDGPAAATPGVAALAAALAALAKECDAQVCPEARAAAARERKEVGREFCRKHMQGPEFGADAVEERRNAALGAALRSGDGTAVMQHWLGLEEGGDVEAALEEMGLSANPDEGGGLDGTGLELLRHVRVKTAVAESETARNCCVDVDVEEEVEEEVEEGEHGETSKKIVIKKTLTVKRLGCPVCFEAFPSFCKQLPCEHIFCESCAQHWLRRKANCPLCRDHAAPAAGPSRIEQLREQMNRAAEVQARGGVASGAYC